jgi:DNA-binding transcriptional MerR regulator
MTPNRAYNLRARIVQDLRERGHSIREVQMILLLPSRDRVRALEARARRISQKPAA